MANGKADYYDILGVNKTASPEEIKKAYRKQALEWHPDRHKDNKEAAEKRFKEINEAYQVLADAQKRQSYDQFGHSAFTPGGGGFSRGARSGGQGANWGPFSYSYSTSGGPFANADFGDPFDIFEQFFGGSFGRSTRLPRYSITIDFLEAAHGVEKQVEIEGKKRSIKIPAGIDEGNRINFNDFILSVNIKPHSKFERDGSDIYLNLDVPYSMATLGGEVKVPTIDDEVKIKIKGGTQSGTMMRLKGMGMKRLQSFGRGDQYVRINVSVPSRLSREQKQLFEELREEGL